VEPHASSYPFAQLQLGGAPIRPQARQVGAPHVPPLYLMPADRYFSTTPLALVHCSIDLNWFITAQIPLQSRRKLGSVYYQPSLERVTQKSSEVVLGRGERASARTPGRRSHLSFGKAERHTTDQPRQESIGIHSISRPEGLREQKTCPGSHQKS